MPTLTELKAKWFIDIITDNFVPYQGRYLGSELRPSTDGNLVTWLIDGQRIMSDFKQRVDNMIGAADPSQHELWIASWRLNKVKLLGETNPGPTAYDHILDAARAGVKVYYLGSGHMFADHNGEDPEDFGKELRSRGSEGAEDNRFPNFGSNHQKFHIFRGPGNDWSAMVGSADLSFTRWDTPSHAPTNPDRPDAAGKKGGPTHDVALLVRGPVVYDIAVTFAERWNDVRSRRRTDPRLTSTIPTTFLAIPLPSVGSHSVQVLRTYGIEEDDSYSFGFEFTIWASYLNAIRRAQTYIYIEDQYFYTFNDPPAVEAGPGLLRNTDLVWQLGEALKRQVDVVLVLAGRSEDNCAAAQMHQRGKALSYLKNIAGRQETTGRFVPCFLQVEDVAGGARKKVQPVVHSKLMLVDDEFALVGSANFTSRSMAHDGEIHLGIVDESESFVRDLRLALWQEHLELADTTGVLDPRLGVMELENRARSEDLARGRLRIHSTADPGLAPCYLPLIWDTGIDPYEGQDRGDEDDSQV